MGRQTRVRETATVSVSLAFLDGGFAMPRGSKSAYTGKQKRKAEHIEESYRRRGIDKMKPPRARGLRSTRRMGRQARWQRQSADRAWRSRTR